MDTRKRATYDQWMITAPMRFTTNEFMFPQEVQSEHLYINSKTFPTRTKELFTPYRKCQCPIENHRCIHYKSNG